MLKLNPNPTFEANVEITVPGQEETGTISLTFKYRSSKEYWAWVESIKEQKEPDKLDKEGKVLKQGKVIRKEKTAFEAFLEFVEGWELPEKFTKENVEIFLNNYPMAYAEIVGSYVKLLLGSRVKN